MRVVNEGNRRRRGRDFPALISLLEEIAGPLHPLHKAISNKRLAKILTRKGVLDEKGRIADEKTMKAVVILLVLRIIKASYDETVSISVNEFEELRELEPEAISKAKEILEHISGTENVNCCL